MMILIFLLSIPNIAIDLFSIIITNIYQQISNMELLLNIPQDNKGQKPSSARRRKRTTLANDIDKDILDFVVNKSYTKKMAGYGKVDSQQIMNAFSDFILNFIPEEDVEQELQQFWCIVALNESALKNRKPSGFCSSNVPAFTGDTSKLPLYQLFVGLGSREMRFRSLTNSKHFYVVNMDTVQCALAFSDVDQPNSEHHITINVEGTYDFDFYFTTHTLPYQVTTRYHQDYYHKVCSELAIRTQRVLKNSIEESQGQSFKLLSKELPDPNWMDKRYCTVAQFDRYCQTGDILLFKDNHTFAKVQRFFTNSECDHVGMVFRDERYGICIFQSNGGSGVSLAMWSQLIRYKWFQNIEGIYWRRLEMQEKPDNFQQKIKQFIKVNLHKEYGISLGKLFASKEIQFDDPKDEKNRTYFCSELIAACYKYMGLLEKEKASSNYIPKDFSDKGSMNMINNSALAAERRIVFNEKVLKDTYKFYK